MLNEVSLMVLIMIWLLLLYRIILKYGPMVVWFLIILLVFPIPVSGSFAHHSEHFWRNRRWGHVDGIHIDPGLACCRGFFFGS